MTRSRTKCATDAVNETGTAPATSRDFEPQLSTGDHETPGPDMQRGQSLPRLQQHLGNQAVQQFLKGRGSSAQYASEPTDRFEREADRVAELVTKIPDAALPPTPTDSVGPPETLSKGSDSSTLQRCPACASSDARNALLTPSTRPNSDSSDDVAASSLVGPQADRVSSVGERELVPLPAPSTFDGMPTSSATARRIRSLQAGGGRSLPITERAFFEPRFGVDFADVRVHTSSLAQQTATSLGARAFTVGREIAFGAGQYRPGTSGGRKLLAHELAHVVQQRRFTAIQRQPTASAANASAGIEMVDADEGASSISIPFRGSVRSSLFSYLQTFVSPEEAARITSALLDNVVYYQNGQRVSLEVFEQLATQNESITLLPSFRQQIVQETGLGEQELRERAEIAEVLAPALEALEGGVGPETVGPGSDEETLRDAGPVEQLRGQWEVLSTNTELSRSYLRLMQHFGGLTLTDEVRALATGGLSIEELDTIVGARPLLRAFTDLFTQGYREFSLAGGSELDHFERLEERMLEQFVRGNPSAVRNQLKIGRGWPERDQLGIVHRPSGMLYYDELGLPLPSIAGGMMRDPGYAGAPPPDFGLNIARISDPFIRGLLNRLRQTVGDPIRVVGVAAEVYFENVELVNAKVQDGLSEEIQQKFSDALPVFIGFLAGHGLSTLLMRVPNPIVAGVGAALKGLLTAAGYVMSIDFAGSAMERLLQAASHLSRVRQAEDGQLTDLSQHHLEEAAQPIRSMVADIALTIGTAGLTRFLGVLRGRGAATIRCTRCRVQRVRAREQRRRGRGQQLGYTLSQIKSLRRQIVRRDRVTRIESRAHSGALGHQVPDAVILRTINNPQVILLARNGNWVFYKNGTIVITPQGNLGAIQTAFGRGGTVPQRRLGDLRRLHPDRQLNVGDPEPPVRLRDWISQQSGNFEAFRIWP